MTLVDIVWSRTKDTPPPRPVCDPEHGDLKERTGAIGRRTGIANRIWFFQSVPLPLAHPGSQQDETASFLDHLAVHRKASVSTPNQALATLLILLPEVLHLDIPRINDSIRAKQPTTGPPPPTKPRPSLSYTMPPGPFQSPLGPPGSPFATYCLENRKDLGIGQALLVNKDGTTP